MTSFCTVLTALTCLTLVLGWIPQQEMGPGIPVCSMHRTSFEHGLDLVVILDEIEWSSSQNKTELVKKFLIYLFNNLCQSAEDLHIAYINHGPNYGPKMRSYYPQDCVSLLYKVAQNSKHCPSVVGGLGLEALNPSEMDACIALEKLGPSCANTLAPCANGGSCHDGAYCICLPGFTGYNCETYMYNKENSETIFNETMEKSWNQPDIPKKLLLITDNTKINKDSIGVLLEKFQDVGYEITGVGIGVDKQMMLKLVGGEKRQRFSVDNADDLESAVAHSILNQFGCCTSQNVAKDQCKPFQHDFCTDEPNILKVEVTGFPTENGIEPFCKIIGEDRELCLHKQNITYFCEIQNGNKTLIEANLTTEDCGDSPMEQHIKCALPQKTNVSIDIIKTGYSFGNYTVYADNNITVNYHKCQVAPENIDTSFTAFVDTNYPMQTQTKGFPEMETHCSCYVNSKYNVCEIVDPHQHSCHSSAFTSFKYFCELLDVDNKTLHSVNANLSPAEVLTCNVPPANMTGVRVVKTGYKYGYSSKALHYAKNDIFITIVQNSKSSEAANLALILPLVFLLILIIAASLGIVAYLLWRKKQKEMNKRMEYNFDMPRTNLISNDFVNRQGNGNQANGFPLGETTLND